jgi:hypothetical protein
LSNIEHSEYICDDGCGRVDVRGAVEGPWPLCLNCGARVTEYVPADAYRGAVDALRWALGFIEYQGEPSPLDDPREGEADAESYRRALAIVGGQ